ncbi:type II toxin-antitoxin system VapC family toxin [Pannus brasiliensis CCIBt3594]|uniref:Type II toxin-antitoxin system VapC family toxin n=1 Tax=Pannus brasiliensis CCIBt3594 TaxID=1427578 RepID=A0AAW9QJB6_9CHRO
MNYLLDTHVFLWYVLGDRSLSDRARQIIDAKTGLHFSIVSLWEISIKVNIGKLQLDCSFEDLLTRLRYINAEILPIEIQDTRTYIDLPSIENHRDPFDRLLVTRAINRSLVFVSADRKFDFYSPRRIWT